MKNIFSKKEQNDKPVTASHIEDVAVTLKGEVPLVGKEKAISIAKKLCKRWFIDAFSGMALGLFATLIAGTILVQIGNLIGGNSNNFAKLLISVGGIAKISMGAGIGAGIAYMLKADKLTIFSCIVAGFVGANGSGFAPIAAGIGNPIGAYLAALFSVEVCKFVAGKTKLDIILVPLTTMLVSALVVMTLCKPVSWLILQLSNGIALSMQWNPIIMGIVISVVMGILLTMPTSSAAIWVMIAGANATSPYLALAGGAAVVGCAAQMVGFAVSSFRENKWSGLISQGLGTSMLQIPNIMKNPKILIPPTIASAVVGPLATSVFMLKCNATGGGMGTAGLVGVFGTIEASTDVKTWMLVLGIILLFFVLPAVISLFVSEIMRKFGWIKPGDMALKF